MRGIGGVSALSAFCEPPALGLAGAAVVCSKQKRMVELVWGGKLSMHPTVRSDSQSTRVR